jgi:hypothetical protein
MRKHDDAWKRSQRTAPGSEPRRWDSFGLFTPARYDGLPGSRG